MPQIIVSQKALNDIERFKDFMLKVAPTKVQEVTNVIFDKFEVLAENPKIGQVACHIEEIRRLRIPYGKNGYTAYYSYDEEKEIVRIETIRHYREQVPDFNKL